MNRSLWLLALALPLLAGCFTTQRYAGLNGRSSPDVYAGTRILFDVVDFESKEVYYLFDLPFSFVADTALLPVTLPMALVRG